MNLSTKGPIALLVACYALWGGGMVALKFAFESFSVIHVVFGRVAFPAAFYMLIFPLWRRLPYQKGDWKLLLALVLFEPVLLFLFETLGLKHTSASQAGVITACFPVCTAVLAWIFLGEKLGRRMILALVLAVTGVAGSSYFASGDGTASNPVLGNLLMMGAVLSTSSYAVCVRFVSRRYSFLSISAIQAVGGAIILSPLMLASPLPSLDTVTPAAWAGMLYMGVGVGIAVYLCFNLSLKFVKAGIVALFGNLIPVFTLLFAWLILDEQMSLPQMGCVALALAGVVLATAGERPSQAPS